jgi:hypothetical protein
VASEWKYYLDEGKTVIPVLLRETKINFRLRPLNYIDFSRQDYEVALAQLRAELERHDVAFGPHGADAAGVPLPADESGRSVRTLALGVAIAVLALAAVILAASALLDFSGDGGKKSGEPSPEDLAQTLVARRDATQTAAALVLEPVATSAPNLDNLLQNPSFETPYNAVESEAQTLHVADGWQPWYVLTDDNGHIVYAVPDYEPAPADRARSGNTAQSFGVDGLGFDGGAYQVVTVTPGAQLSFVAYFDKESGTSGDVHVSVGIDPTGGTDATSTAVIWSVSDTLTDEYRALSVQATAQGAQVTVFLRGETDPASTETALVYVDDAALTALGGS